MKVSNAEGRELLNKTRKKPKNEESKLQCSFVEWFRGTYPQYAKLLAAIPNGGKRGIITASILKKEGVLAGFPDTVLAVPKNGYSGLFIEFKHGNNTLSPKQREIQAELRGQGYAVRNCWTLEQAQTAVKGYLAEF